MMGYGPGWEGRTPEEVDRLRRELSAGVLSGLAYVAFEMSQVLQREEAFVPFAYEDKFGYWTIGYGRLIDRRKGGGITREEAMVLLDNDIWRILAALRKRLSWFDNLDAIRKVVLACMAYQLGVEGLLGFHATLAAVSEQRWGDAHDGMMRSAWARQTPARAARMAHAMLTGKVDDLA